MWPFPQWLCNKHGYRRSFPASQTVERYTTGVGSSDADTTHTQNGTCRGPLRQGFLVSPATKAWFSPLALWDIAGLPSVTQRRVAREEHRRPDGGSLEQDSGQYLWSVPGHAVAGARPMQAPCLPASEARVSVGGRQAPGQGRLLLGRDSAVQGGMSYHRLAFREKPRDNGKDMGRRVMPWGAKVHDSRHLPSMNQEDPVQALSRPSEGKGRQSQDDHEDLDSERWVSPADTEMGLVLVSASGELPSSPSCFTKCNSCRGPNALLSPAACRPLRHDEQTAPP